LNRLTYRSADATFDSQQTVAMMIHTVELEQEIGIGTTYFDCFKGIDLRRTEIACMVWSIQTLSGSGFRSFSTYFFQQAGLATDQSFSLAIGQYAIGIFGVFISWFLMPLMGRRTLFFYGLALMMTCLTIVGALGCAPGSNGSAKWGVASLAIVYVFFYDATVGPVTYSLVSEIPSTNLRTKTVVLARNSYNILNIASNVYTPYMINPTAGNLKAKSGFVWAGICFVCLFWVWFRLPEPKDRTFAELDILFESKIPAREFAKTKVDAFVIDNGVKVVEENHEKI
jgi:MFS transporter, SP family, general alpha glucoside:H+ symporter